ncbi:MAG: M14 family zinc carboxypeptidase [Bacteroidota bacterium]
MKSFLLLVCVLIAAPLYGEDEEHYFRFTVREKSELARLARVISIDDVRGATVFAYANGREWAAFRDLGYLPEELPHPGGLYRHEMAHSPEGMLAWDRYPTYQGYLGMMASYAAAHSGICRLDTFGTSVQGRLLLMMKITSNPHLRHDRPRFVYVSSLHGDETVGYILLLRLIDYMLTNYGQDTPLGQRITNLVDNVEICINPLANPDGTYRLGGDTTVSNARRYNVNGLDLNRDFPDRIDDTVNTGTGRQQETRMAMEWVRTHNAAMSANFHGGAAVVNYPWDNGAPSGSYSMCPDDGWFIQASLAYSLTNPDLLAGGWTNGITNGCAWYSISGGRQDWIYWWHGGRETTIELHATKNPAGSTLPQRWENNKESLLAYMEKVLGGVRGLVTDLHTGLPLKATVHALGIPGVPVYTDSAVGNYHRLLSPGTYRLIVSAPGFHTDTTASILVTGSLATRVNVALRSTTVDVAEEGVRGGWHLGPNYPNPFNPSTEVGLRVPAAGRAYVGVYDLLGREVRTVFEGDLEPGLHALRVDGTGLAGGVYYLRMRAVAHGPETGRSPGGGATGVYVQTRKIMLLK